jgi:hypothetical protein
MSPHGLIPSLKARHLVAGLVAVVMLAFGSGAVAGGTFTDVSSSHPFSQHVENIVGAGITTGFDDGTYRPGAPVSRGAMAAFVARGFGRVGNGTGSATSTTTESVVTFAQTTMTAGAVGSGGGFVQVTANVIAATEDFGDCPCLVLLSLSDGTTIQGPTAAVISDDDAVLGTGQVSVATNTVFSIPAGATRTYQIRGAYSAVPANPSVEFEGEITATYVPFGPSGGNSL